MAECVECILALLLAQEAQPPRTTHVVAQCLQRGRVAVCVEVASFGLPLSRRWRGEEAPVLRVPFPLRSFGEAEGPPSSGSISREPGLQGPKAGQALSGATERP